MATSKKTKEELKLTTDQTEKLIELYFMETDLWNVSSQSYFKKECRRNALQRMKDKMTEEYDVVCSVEQIQWKLSYLRGYYSKELAKVNKSKKSGAGVDEIYSSSWVHFKVLDNFLKKQIAPRPSQSNLDISSQNDEDDLDADQDEVSSQCSEASEDHTTPSRRPCKKSRLPGPESVMAEAMTCLQDIRKRNNEKQALRPEDGDTVFGQYVACELRKISDERSKAYLKFKIQSLIFESQYGSPHVSSYGNPHSGATGYTPVYTGNQNQTDSQPGPRHQNFRLTPY